MQVGTLKEAVFAKKKVMIGEVARRFRKTLMAEHLGVLTKESRDNLDWDYTLLDDPVCDEFYHNVWCKTADMNMDLFDKVFSCLPSNELHSFADVKLMRQHDPLFIRDSEQAKQLVKGIRGHLVRYPEDFLRDEDISPPQGSKEIVVPAIVWT
uniref:Phospholipase D n=1 Tax=Mesocestoides corti TaxID=53468 RepID=A0A5K3F5I2_MESCO